MHARIREVMDKRQNGEKGFTLIELLVVIIIIGILAAIAIPAFLNQRQKAWASQVESDVKNAAIAAESYAVGNNGSYDKLDETALASNGFNETKDVDVKVQNVTANSYELVGTNTNLGATRTFTYKSEDGVIVDSAKP
ncbi:prepilin-type N-terminal cleavage/methylation domain-containing protein [Cellulomonas sp. PS-H5]|uniref:prepilin-type N-terminal cleavage/methylation domain-containing protein n=1 Tax=Cellulomonas sp. PS-H5 TaxID=2820400 RepID=UPI001C4E5FE5|nr:prepilin-type N-terminal cleavage/methylation domain-containing protein [Cellulomonas sp. PS-H5]MBW0255426.1 prepilin-type N-terminal cleavage/methylation domain-containing protein [Cellulomonas sp. PS-H5]